MGTQITTATARSYQLLILSDDSRWGIYNSTTAFAIYNSLDGTPAVETSVTNSTIFGSAVNIDRISAVVDSNDDVWVVASSTDTSTTPKLRRYDSSASSWAGSWVSVIPSFTEIPTGSVFVNVVVDTNNYVGVFYTNYAKNKGVTQAVLSWRYTTNGISFSTPEIVGTIPAHDYAEVVCDADGSFSGTGNVYAMYWDVTDGDMNFRIRASGTWGTEGTISNSYRSNLQGSYNSRLSLIDASTQYKYTLGATDTLYEDDSSTSQTLEDGTGSNAVLSGGVASGIRYVLGRTPSDTTALKLVSYDTSWSVESTAVEDESALILGVATFYQSVNDNSPTTDFPYLYYVNATGLYYGEYSLSGATTYYQSNAGAETPTGALTKKKTSKTLVGTETSSGSLIKKALKALSATFTSSGNVAKKSFWTFEGSETDSGDVTLRKFFSKLLEGAMSSSGELLKLTKKIFSGNETSTGEVSKKSFWTFVGSMNSSGEILRKIFKSLSGDMNSSGILTTLRKAFASLAGAMNSSGDITKKIAKILVGSEDDTGNLIKKTIMLLTGSETATGFLDAVKQAGIYYQLLEGAMNSSGDLALKTKKTLSGAMDSSGEILRKIFKSLSGNMNSSGIVSILKTSFELLAGSMDSSGTIKKLTKKIFSGDMNSSGDILRKVYKILLGDQNFSGDLIKKTIKLLSGVMGSSGFLDAIKLGNTYFQSLSGAMDSSGTIARTIMKILLGSETSTGNLIKKTKKIFTASFDSSGILNAVKQGGIFYKSLAGSMNSSGILIKNIKKLLSGNMNSSGIVTTIHKIFVALSGSMDSSGIVSTIRKSFISLFGDMDSSGSLIKLTKKLFSGNETSTGDLIKKTKKLFTASFDSSGFLSAVKDAGIFYKSLTGSMGSSGTLTKATSKLLTGSETPVGDLSKKMFIALSGLMDSSGLLNAVKGAVTYYKTLVGDMDSSGTVIKKTSKILSGAYDSAGDIVKKTMRSLSGDMDSSGNIFRAIYKTLSGSMDSSGAYSTIKTTFLLLRTEFSSSGEIYRKTKKRFLGVTRDGDFEGNLKKKTKKIFSGSSIFIGILDTLFVGELLRGTAKLTFSKVYLAILNVFEKNSTTITFREES